MVGVCNISRKYLQITLFLLIYTAAVVMILTRIAFIAQDKYNVIVDELRSFAPYVPNSYRTSGIDSFDVEGFLIDLGKFLKNGNGNTVNTLIRPNTLKQVTKDNLTVEQVVCPEEYKGVDYGYPFYHKGFVTTKCKGLPPLESIITIFINHINVSNSSFKNLRLSLKGIRTIYNNVPILIAMPDSSSVETVDEIEQFNVTVIRFKSSASAGHILNSLPKGLVTTPYVLVARDLIHFSWFSPIDRSLRVLTEIQNVKIVAGAHRNKTGYWKAGCYQREIKYYALKYTEGYHKSKNECMYCDHVSGSFVTSVNAIKNRPFDEELPIELVFTDWFIEITMDGHFIMTCPDVLYFQSSSDIENNSGRKSWIPLANKWKTDLVITPQRRFLYSCSDISIDCYNFGDNKIRQLARPPCCMRLLAHGMKEWYDFCVKHELCSELDTGFALGAVKTNGMTPWDSDGDMIFKLKNFSFIYQHQSELDSSKMKLTNWLHPLRDPEDMEFTGNSYFALRAGGVKVEMFSEGKCSNEQFLPKEFRNIPTTIKFLGTWAYGPANPGMYSRNRYGNNYLQHAQSWWITNKKSSFDPYEISHFEECKNPRHHGCLSHFSVDGNIQFQRL